MIDLAGARILVCNDDGIHAPGLKILEKVAKELSDDVWVVAPETEQSASGHSLTLTVPLRVRKIHARRFAINGTPTDCVLLAVNLIMRGKRPDLVLSGVNSGGNLGEDITYSGTVAAAMEATLLNIPAVALSQMRAIGRTPMWSTAAHHAATVIRKIRGFDFPAGMLVNVNFPDVHHDEVLGIAVTRQGRRKIGDVLTSGTDPRGYPYVWIGSERDEDPSFTGSDLRAVHRGFISVTPLTVDMTFKPAMRALREVFA